MNERDDTKDWGDIIKKFQTLVKGENPNDLKKKCLRLCQQYLAGNWTQLKEDDVEIKRLTGGMVNMVYYCKIPDNLQDKGTEPKEVAIRFYGTNFDFSNWDEPRKTMEDNIKYLLLSENGLGPKVYGLLECGAILKYYKHRLFTEDDLNDKSVLNDVAIKLARMHAMKPPINRTKSLIVEGMSSSNKWFCSKLDVKRKLFEELNCKTLLDFDVKAETDWILSKLKSIDSALVFSHNDFRFGNILVTEKNGLVVGDFDATGYFFRGYDFLTFFFDFVKLDEKKFEFKNESIVRDFIDKYLIESAIINGKQYLEIKTNSIEHIMTEMKVLSLVYLAMLFNFLLTNEMWKLPFDDSTLLQIATSEVEKFQTIKMLLGDF